MTSGHAAIAAVAEVFELDQRNICASAKGSRPRNPKYVRARCAAVLIAHRMGGGSDRLAPAFKRSGNNLRHLRRKAEALLETDPEWAAMVESAEGLARNIDETRRYGSLPGVPEEDGHPAGLSYLLVAVRMLVERYEDMGIDGPQLTNALNSVAVAQHRLDRATRAAIKAEENKSRRPG